MKLPEDRASGGDREPHCPSGGDREGTERREIRKEAEGKKGREGGKERERTAMGERSAMAGAWKEDEDRERTTRGWTPFGIIALLHTSATRP